MVNECPEYPHFEIKTEIVESGTKRYCLTIKRVKTRIIISDEQGNKVKIDKREGKMKLVREGDVHWHNK